MVASPGTPTSSSTTPHPHGFSCRKFMLVSSFVAMFLCLSSTCMMMVLSRQLVMAATMQPTETTVGASNSDTIFKPPPVFTIDILSIGSMTRPLYQQVQRATFGSHASVRHFVTVTELNDTETNCHVNLTADQVAVIQKFCRNGKKPHPVLQSLSRIFATPHYLKSKGNPAGWMCAQKRPIDGLELVFRLYKGGREHLPDYLFVIDDDTYINMPEVLQLLNSTEYQDHARIVTGCLSRVKYMNFSFAYGGWGTFFTRKTLERFQQPIYCPSTANETDVTTTSSASLLASSASSSGDVSSNDDFVRNACRQLTLNGIGERDAFVPGMSVFSLMVQYARNQPYLDFEHWNAAGYCLHSDTALAYFANFYHLAEHATSVPGMGHPLENYWYEQDRLIGYQGSVWFADQGMPSLRYLRRQCTHQNDASCPPTAHLCHNITPAKMQQLYYSNANHNNHLNVSSSSSSSSAVV